METLRFELCVESLESARIGEAGGADRVELCSALWMGGVTPPLDLIAATAEALAIPVRVLIRPRGGDFCYSAAEFDLMRQQIEEAKQAGAAGIVVGVLLEDGRVDVARSRELVELARPMGATFHRAFDETRQMEDALEDVIATGAECLLTSGGAADVIAGAETIARLHKQAGKRIDVMAGGGLRLDNVMDLVRRTGVTSLHGSLMRGNARSGAELSRMGDRTPVVEADVREAIRLFHEAHGVDGAAPVAG